MRSAAAAMLAPRQGPKMAENMAIGKKEKLMRRNGVCKENICVSRTVRAIKTPANTAGMVLKLDKKHTSKLVFSLLHSKRWALLCSSGMQCLYRKLDALRAGITSPFTCHLTHKHLLCFLTGFIID